MSEPTETPAPEPITLEQVISNPALLRGVYRHRAMMGGRPKGSKTRAYFHVSKEMLAILDEIGTAVPKKGERKPADLVVLLQCELMKQTKQVADFQDGIALLAKVWKLFAIERSVKEKDTSDKDLREVELDYRKLAGGAINGARRMGGKKQRPDDDNDD